MGEIGNAAAVADVIATGPGGQITKDQPSGGAAAEPVYRCRACEYEGPRSEFYPKEINGTPYSGPRCPACDYSGHPSPVDASAIGETKTRSTSDQPTDTAAGGGTAPASDPGGRAQVAEDQGPSDYVESMRRCNTCGYVGVLDSDNNCPECGWGDTAYMSDEEVREHIAKELGDKLGSGKSEADRSREELEERQRKERQMPPQEPPRESIMDEIDPGPGPIA